MRVLGAIAMSLLFVQSSEGAIQTGRYISIENCADAVVSLENGTYRMDVSYLQGVGHCGHLKEEGPSTFLFEFQGESEGSLKRSESLSGVYIPNPARFFYYELFENRPISVLELNREDTRENAKYEKPIVFIRF
jgi:hypothetical protein